MSFCMTSRTSRLETRAILPKSALTRQAEGAGGSAVYREDGVSSAQGTQVLEPEVRPAKLPSRDVAVSFLRLANLASELVDRLSRYEAGLWRQLVQALFALQTLKRR